VAENTRGPEIGTFRPSALAKPETAKADWPSTCIRRNEVEPSKGVCDVRTAQRERSDSKSPTGGELRAIIGGENIAVVKE
jgi:hypothetical protein